MTVRSCDFSIFFAGVTTVGLMGRKNRRKAKERQTPPEGDGATASASSQRPSSAAPQTPPPVEVAGGDSPRGAEGGAQSPDGFEKVPKGRPKRAEPQPMAATVPSGAWGREQQSRGAAAEPLAQQLEAVQIGHVERRAEGERSAGPGVGDRPPKGQRGQAPGQSPAQPDRPAKAVRQEKPSPPPPAVHQLAETPQGQGRAPAGPRPSKSPQDRPGSRSPAKSPSPDRQVLQRFADDQQLPMTRYGTKGRRLLMFANYLRVEVNLPTIYHYDVTIKSLTERKRAGGAGDGADDDRLPKRVRW